MRNWGRFKVGGSLIAAALGVISGAAWLDDEKSGPKPEKPSLSDPDSDALYAINTDEDAQAAHRDNEGLPLGTLAPVAAPERRESLARPASSLTLGIAPPSEPAEYRHPALIGTERSNPAPPPPSGLLRSAPNNVSQMDQDALEPAMPADRAAHLENEPLPIEEEEPLKAVAGAHEEARSRAQPLSQLSLSAPPPSTLRVATSTSGAALASGSPLEIPAHASVEYPAAQHSAAAVTADIARPVQPLAEPLPPVPSPSAHRSDTSTDGGGFTSASALDVFAPAASPLPQLTAASYASNEPAPQRIAAAPAPSAAPSPDTSEAEVLVLASVVNGTPGNQIITVERRASGFTLQAEDLRALRVKLDPAIKDGDSVALSSLPGVQARYVEASQSIALTIPDALLIPTLIEGRPGRVPIDVSKISTASGLLFNYRLFGTAQSDDSRAVQLTGDTEIVGMTRVGLFVTNGFFSSGGRRTFVRGDSFFRYEDVRNVRTYTVGDFATGALNFSRSVRLGGIQIQSDFQQRPDLFTGPLPQFAGSAALPSSLELYADNLRIFSTRVPQGPFVLRSLPQISGNELRIVTTDASGRQTEITTPYFDAPGLLRKGLLEYSAELGAPRINAGLRSFDYRSKLFGSATARYGLSERLTVEGHLEAGGDLINGGIGIIQALGPLGSVTASASGSAFRGRQGTRLSGQYRFDLKRFSLFANVEREYGRYFDLGDVSAVRGPVTDPTGADLFPRRAKRSLERFGASFRPGFDPVSFNVAYNRLRLGNSEIRTANFAVRRRVTNRISFRGDALFDLKSRGDVALSAGLDIRLGRNTSAFAGADRANGRSSYNLSVNGFSGGRQNALGYSFAQRGNDDGDASRSASVNYRLPQAFVAASLDQSGNQFRVAANIEGSVIAAGKDVFVANRVGEGFAIVKNAGPGVDILQGGRKIARSNSKGRALLSSLEAFSETRVAIDPTSLPADLEAENGTDFRIVTGRRRAALVDFGVRQVNSAIVVIMGPGGKPIPPGTLINLGSGEPGLMGYDGEVFLKDLKARNSATIDLGAAGKCTATFSYDIEGEPQPVIGPITCS